MYCQFFSVKQALPIMAALIVCASSAMAAENDEITQQAMLAMQYADAQECFIINGDEVQPVLPLLVSSDGLPNVKHEHVIAALDAALARGCDINQPDLQGLSPLNTAILQGNIVLADYLLSHGADAKQTINSDHAAINGLDSLALLEMLRQKNPNLQQQWQALQQLLNKSY